MTAHALDERNAIQIGHAKVDNGDIEGLGAQQRPRRKPVFRVNCLTIEAHEPRTHQVAQDRIVVGDQDAERVACIGLVMCVHGTFFRVLEIMRLWFARAA